MRVLTGIATLVLFCITLYGCGEDGVYKETRTLMGTYVTITAERGEIPEILVRVAVNDAFGEIERVDRLMSTYRDDSELSAANRSAGVLPVPVSEDTAACVRLALDISRMTDGAFDPTVGPLVKLWSVTAKDAEVPSEEEIRSALGFVDYKEVEVADMPDGGHTLYIGREGMSLDLGGVAKGYASDLAVRKLREKGVEAGIVAVAGDLKVFGKRVDGSGWRIGIQHPRQKGELLTKLDLTDASTSTSGDYERFFVNGGVRYHHIIDPRTGYPARGLMSVSVLTEDSYMADALATAVFVMGPVRAGEFAASHGDISVLMVTEDGRTFATGSFDGLELAQVTP